MFSVFGIGFAAPALLFALIGLPVLWILLRAVPPAPVMRRFPGVVLLLGLRDRDSQSDKTPWWLLLLRMTAIGAVIVGLAGPVLNPKTDELGRGPLLILLDATWASAQHWEQHIDRVKLALDDAAQNGRRVAVVSLSDPAPGAIQFQTADVWRSRLPGIQPNAWLPDQLAVDRWIEGLDGRFDTIWLSDGLQHERRAAVLDALQQRGTVSVAQGPVTLVALRPAVMDAGAVVLSAVRLATDGSAQTEVRAIGTDPAGNPRALLQAVIPFVDGEDTGQAVLSVQPELRNRITRYEIVGAVNAGAVSLTDDALRRREVALVSGGSDREGLQLLSSTHFLEQALRPSVDLIDGALVDILLANPDVIVLADVASLAEREVNDVTAWIRAGGLLLRFAGPRLAASNISRSTEDPLMPVRLRRGGRELGGAMSWGQPKKLRPFDERSPFFGLNIPDDVQVSAQVVAQPDVNLSARVIAALDDGTPLVTRKQIGNGQVVLFHITANTQWSTLPLSGLFVQMLDRLSVSSSAARPTNEDLAGTTWVQSHALDGFGQLEDVGSNVGISGELLAEERPGAAMPPGLYQSQGRAIALNVVNADTVLRPAIWPVGVAVQSLLVDRATILKPYLLLLALALLAIDGVASLWISGKLFGLRAGAVATILGVLMVGVLWPAGRLMAQDDLTTLAATSEVVLAHVRTGDAQVDKAALAGLRGLTGVLFARTSVEPAAPASIDLETDEIAFYPILYWPITAEQSPPSAAAYARLNRYLRNGGMILFDTRDANFAGLGATSANGRKLQQLARPLNIPPLEPIPADHVLTRAFYLLQEFPGRHAGRDIWVEASPAGAEQIEGMPFRNLNDNVTPVVLGGNDWAAAWAVDAAGNWMFPVGRGTAGAQQREIALRFGVNLVMHVLTGNYKSDQVHVPALLERLGQ